MLVWLWLFLPLIILVKFVTLVLFNISNEVFNWVVELDFAIKDFIFWKGESDLPLVLNVDFWDII